MKVKVISAVIATGLLVMAGQSFAASGKDVYEATCAACHASGAAGAPKLGDKAAWAPRIKAGADAMHASALKGKGVMPAKGGNSGLADADVLAAVDYMVAQSK
jgi:cytochrome c5